MSLSSDTVSCYTTSGTSLSTRIGNAHMCDWVSLASLSASLRRRLIACTRLTPQHHSGGIISRVPSRARGYGVKQSSSYAVDELNLFQFIHSLHCCIYCAILFVPISPFSTALLCLRLLPPALLLSISVSFTCNPTLSHTLTSLATFDLQQKLTRLQSCQQQMLELLLKSPDTSNFLILRLVQRSMAK